MPSDYSQLVEALEGLAHESMDARELAYLTDMQQEDIADAREALPLARQLIEERDKYKTLWEDRKRLVDEENEQLNRGWKMYVSGRDRDVQDLQSRLSTVEADAEAWRWLCDNLPEDFDGDGALEVLVAEAVAETSRLQVRLSASDDRIDQLQTENEVLLRQFDVSVQGYQSRLSEQYKTISVLKDKNEELVLEHLSCPHAAEVYALQSRLSAAEEKNEQLKIEAQAAHAYADKEWQENQLQFAIADLQAHLSAAEELNGKQYDELVERDQKLQQLEAVVEAVRSVADDGTPLDASEARILIRRYEGG